MLRLLFLLFAAQLAAQPLPPATRFTVREGLAQQQVRGFLEDSRGYIWIATQGGLSRFDGRNLQSYGRDQGYRGNRVYDLKEAPDGSIWYDSDEGVFRLDGVEETLLPHTPEFWEKQEPPLWDLVLLSEVLNRRFPLLEGLGLEYRYLFDSNGRPVAMDFKHQRLILLEKGGEVMEMPKEWLDWRLDNVTFSNKFVNDNFSYHVLHPDGTFRTVARYLRDLDTCLLLDRPAPNQIAVPPPYNSYWILKGDQYQRLPLMQYGISRIDRLQIDRYGRAHVGTDEGYIFLPLNGLERLKVPGLRYPWATLPVKDHPGEVWLSDYREGLFRIDTAGRVLERHAIPGNNPDIYQLFPGKCAGLDGTLLFGAYKGFFLLKNDRLRHFQLGEPIEALVWDARQNSFLVGGKNLYRIDAGLQRVLETIQLPADFTLGNGVTDIEITGEGDYWVSGTGGVLRRTAAGAVTFIKAGSDELPPGKYNSLLADNAGTIWAGGYGGLLRLDGSAFRPVLPELFGSPVNDLLALPDSRLAVITDRALVVLDIRRPAQPLLETWLDDQNGFDLLEPAENGASWDGTHLWIPASNGLQRWSPDELHWKEQWPARLRVDRVRDSLVSLVTDTAHVLLHRSNARLLMSLVWWGPPEVRYEYRLDGTGWVAAGLGPVIEVSGLRHGFNRVFVRAVLPGRPEDEWPETAIVLRTDLPLLDRPDVQRAFWGLGLVGLFLLLWVSLWYFRERQQKRLAMSQLDETRLQAVLAQLNPHMLFNLLTSLQNSIENRSSKQASGHLVQIARLLREILELSMPPEAGNKYAFPVITLEREVAFLRDYLELERMQQSQPFAYAIETSGIKHPERCCLPPLLVQPLLENAVLHGIRPTGRHCRIGIRFNTEGDWLNITVEDDGMGRAAAAAAEKKGLFQHRSRGGALLRERLDLLTKLGYPSSLILKDRKDGGTIARLRVKNMQC